MENYNNISSDTGQDKNERQPVGRITCTTISILTLDKLKLNDMQYEELHE